MHFDLSFGQEQYKLTLRPTANDELYESVRTVKTGPQYRPATPEDVGDLSSDYQKWLVDRMLNWRVYHFDDTTRSSPMRKTARVHDNRFLREDGSNLPAFLYLLQENHKESYDWIVRTVQRVAPFFDDFLLEPLQLNPEDIKLEWKHKRSDQYFDASSLSDGTLRFIALATLFLSARAISPIGDSSR
jgi:predicted ATPase